MERLVLCLMQCLPNPQWDQGDRGGLGVPNLRLLLGAPLGMAFQWPGTRRALSTELGLLAAETLQDHIWRTGLSRCDLYLLRPRHCWLAKGPPLTLGKYGKCM